MKPSKEALDKARIALGKITKSFANAIVEPEPCSICGRVIYCGVSKICKVRPCGLIKES